MATRLYYRAGDLPNLTPAFSASGWIRTADAVRRWLDPVKTEPREVLAGIVGGAANDNSLVVQLISPPLAGAQTVSGTWNLVSRSRELASTDNINKRWRAAMVYSGDGGTLRGTLEAPVATASTTELSATTLQGQQHALNAGITLVNAQAGDIIVVEIGLGESAAGTTPNYNSELGGIGTDHANANSDVTGSVPWVEFSANLVFQKVGGQFNSPYRGRW